MKRPKLFIIILSICTLILLLAVLPNTFKGKNASIPGTNKKIPIGNFISNFSDINIQAGPLKINHDFFYSLGSLLGLGVDFRVGLIERDHSWKLGRGVATLIYQHVVRAAD
jgi:hypothetical protein